MKLRIDYVSNSSSSSYLLPFKYDGRVSSIKLPEEVWKAIAKNHVGWDGKKPDMSCSNEWWLTELVSDCCEREYSEISNAKNAIPYLEGHDKPYGWYEEDGEKEYITFKDEYTEYYVLVDDFIDEHGESHIPEVFALRNNAKKILDAKCLNKTQKLEAIRHLFDF